VLAIAKFVGPVLVGSLALSACGMTSHVATTTTTTTSTTTTIIVTTTTQAKISLGNFVDGQIIGVEKAVHDAGLKIASENDECSITVPAGLVISQYPEVGSQLQRGQSVSFVISTGSCTPPCPYVYVNSAGATTCSPSPVLTDPTTLNQTLATVAGQLMGMNPPTNQFAEFVTHFDNLQIAQEKAGALGKPWYEPDPTSEANAFINANDLDAVLAARAANLGNDLNCMINPGMPGCG